MSPAKRSETSFSTMSAHLSSISINWVANTRASLKPTPGLRSAKASRSLCSMRPPLRALEPLDANLAPNGAQVGPMPRPQSHYREPTAYARVPS